MCLGHVSLHLSGGFAAIAEWFFGSILRLTAMAVSL